MPKLDRHMLAIGALFLVAGMGFFLLALTVLLARGPQDCPPIPTWKVERDAAVLSPVRLRP